MRVVAGGTWGQFVKPGPLGRQNLCSQETLKFQCGSWLACDGITWVDLPHRGACLAGKPAPTLNRWCWKLYALTETVHALMRHTEPATFWCKLSSHHSAPAPHAGQKSSAGP